MADHIPVPILFVDTASALGGAELLLLEILNRLESARFAPHLACTDGTLAEKAMTFNIPVHRMPMPRLRRSLHVFHDLSEGIRALAVAARETSATLLVANTVRAAFYAAPVARRLHIPFVWYRHDFWLGESPPRFAWIDTAIKALFCRATARFIANSYATAQQHPCPEKIVVVHNGIEIQRFDPALDGIPFRQAHGIPPDAPVLGIVGRLCPIKGQERFLRVVARVLQAIPEAWGVLVGGPIFGEDDYQLKLQRLALDLGIEQRIAFTGQVNDPKPALAAMDVFVQPGDPEAFGLVNVEAMAMGKPVIGFAHGGLPEIVVENETGFLTPPNDEAAMTAAIVALMRDRPRRMAMGSAGRARAEMHFTLKRAVTEIEVVFETVLREDKRLWKS